MRKQFMIAISHYMSLGISLEGRCFPLISSFHACLSDLSYNKKGHFLQIMREIC